MAGDVRGNAPRLVARQQFRRAAPATLILEVRIGERPWPLMVDVRFAPEADFRQQSQNVRLGSLADIVL
jgi:hypothetical protein